MPQLLRYFFIMPSLIMPSYIVIAFWLWS